ncbi:MAG: GNAT family N-acetyltransferase [Candidatus Melainabacteria bacterium]|nr:GNAT family N-acetyltransferase [Candidatus Melainabacteria bacterium]
MELLDNPIYNALSTSQSDLAIGDALAMRYPTEFTCLAGIRSESTESFDALKNVTAGATVRIISTNAKIVFPENWKCKTSFTVTQMTCPSLIACKAHPFETLTPTDVPAMMELAELAKPGPFYSRTNEFGTFVGIRDGARLVAMAGQRMKLPGLEEVSAVCTHPDYQGRGYARALVFELAKMISERGNVPFLTVKTDNTPGIRSYESIGFEHRRDLQFYFITAD